MTKQMTNRRNSVILMACAQQEVQGYIYYFQAYFGPDRRASKNIKGMQEKTKRGWG